MYYDLVIIVQVVLLDKFEDNHSILGVLGVIVSVCDSLARLKNARESIGGQGPFSTGQQNQSTQF